MQEVSHIAARRIAAGHVRAIFGERFSVLAKATYDADGESSVRVIERMSKHEFPLQAVRRNGSSRTGVIQVPKLVSVLAEKIQNQVVTEAVSDNVCLQASDYLSVGPRLNLSDVRLMLVCGAASVGRWMKTEGFPLPEIGEGVYGLWRRSEVESWANARTGREVVFPLLSEPQVFNLIRHKTTMRISELVKFHGFPEEIKFSKTCRTHKWNSVDVAAWCKSFGQ